EAGVADRAEQLTGRTILTDSNCRIPQQESLPWIQLIVRRPWRSEELLRVRDRISQVRGNCTLYIRRDRRSFRSTARDSAPEDDGAEHDAKGEHHTVGPLPRTRAPRNAARASVALWARPDKQRRAAPILAPGGPAIRRRGPAPPLACARAAVGRRMQGRSAPRSRR